MPTQGLCELGKLAGNTTAARASARPPDERAPGTRARRGGKKAGSRAGLGAAAVLATPGLARPGAGRRRPDRGAPPAPARSQLHRQVAPACGGEGTLTRLWLRPVPASNPFAVASWLCGLNLPASIALFGE